MLNKQRRAVLILQARMGSTRLPGKSMMPIAGLPLIYRILERVKRCRAPDKIVLAIPDTPDNMPLAGVAAELGISVFRGSESDCLDRYYHAAVEYDAELVGRLPADNVCPEPGEIDRIFEHHQSLDRAGFSSNLAQVLENGYPDGIGAEVFDFSLLKKAWQENTSAEQREHVHLNFFNYATQTPVDAEACPVTTVSCPPAFARPDIVLDVNTEEQYRLMSRLYNNIYPKNPDFSIHDVVEWWDNIRPVAAD